MLNINAFFEFKQRTRHVYSFQLAQLMYHAQHVNEYNNLPQQLSLDSARKPPNPQPEEQVRTFQVIRSKTQ